MCEELKCGDNGVCHVTVDTSGIATPECRYVDDFEYVSIILTFVFENI